MEKELETVIRDGGTVRYEKDPSSNFVNVLWIQTKHMKAALDMIKPTVFQSDTTFSTNRDLSKIMSSR